jgi:hypothetical protein
MLKTPAGAIEKLAMPQREGKGIRQQVNSRCRLIDQLLR